MISNGFLFDEETVNKCVDLWNLERVQITLDGTEEIYNKVKAYVNPKENPYQRVLRNIDLLISRKILVNIRLNVGLHNTEDIRVLIEELGERYSGHQHVSVYLNMLYDGMGYEPVRRSFEEDIALRKVIEGLTDQLKKKKLFHNKQKAPSMQVRQCIADNPHSVVVQPDGGFCRCEHETVQDSYGNLDEGILDPQKPIRWTEAIERSDHCDQCPMYPACYLLRYCINSNKKCVQEMRNIFFETQKQSILKMYQKKLEDEKNEKV